MIQQTNPRHHSTIRQAANDGPEQWGQWIGRKHYSLEVVQHPLRARMCGFGDKDRRPLAPAAVAKMIVRREDNTLVDVDDVDCSFFLVTVDLWSADGKQEMNLVLHPSSAERYVPPHSASKTKRRGTSTSGPSRAAGNQTPAGGRSTPPPSQYRSGDQPPSGVTTPQLTAQSTSFNNNGYFSPQTPMSDGMNYTPSTPYAPTPSDPPPAWGYPPPAPPPVDRNSSFPPPILPSIHSFGRASVPVPSEAWHPENGDPEALPYRAWGSDGAYSVENYSGTQQVESALRSSTNSDSREHPSAWSQHENAYSSAPPASQQVDNTVYATTPYTPQPQHAPSPYHPAPYPQPTHTSTSSSAPIPPVPRHTYTRTLVGPLSANACRLLDEHRKPGIFFLFQDLSVRTEGAFRLRLRLMNVGAPPAPEVGAIRVHNDVSPVLAQTFTDQFTVFSAKRFPGVPDTTALSIAFGNQGQKLPLRNRHGSKRRRRGDSESDDDSDGG